MGLGVDDVDGGTVSWSHNSMASPYCSGGLAMIKLISRNDERLFVSAAVTRVSVR